MFFLSFFSPLVFFFFFFFLCVQPSCSSNRFLFWFIPSSAFSISILLPNYSLLVSIFPLPLFDLSIILYPSSLSTFLHHFFPSISVNSLPRQRLCFLHHFSTPRLRFLHSLHPPPDRRLCFLYDFLSPSRLCFLHPSLAPLSSFSPFLHHSFPLISLFLSFSISPSFLSLFTFFQPSIQYLFTL